MINSTEKSTILLMCLGGTTKNDKCVDFTIDETYNMFRVFGEVCKIIVFSKKTDLKIFIEFVEIEDSYNSKVFLHKTKLNNLGKLNVFFSPFQKLEFSNKYLECKEYARPHRVSVNQHLMSTRLSVSETICLAESAFIFDDHPPVCEERPIREVLGEKRNFCNSSLRTSVNSFKRNSENGRKMEEQIVINNSSFRLSGFDKPREDRTTIESRSSVQSNLLPPSNVVLISNLDECFFTATELYNVFSCFGNILRILLMKNLKKALIEFVYENSAKNALDCMNLRVFGNTKIKMNYSKFKTIDLKKNNKSGLSQKFNEVMLVSQEMNRFTQKNHEEIKPSDTLLFVVERSSDFQPVDLFLHLQTSHKMVSTRIIPEDKENEDSSIHKVLFKFKNQKEAIIALSQLHNTEVNGLTLNAVFSQISL